MEEKKTSTRHEKRIKKKKNRRNFAFILFVAFVLCVAFNVIINMGDRLETMIVRRGSEEESIETDGYIFREQTVINAPEGGFLRYEADEDQRVKKGELVAYVYEKEISPSANSELKAVEAEIEKLSSKTGKRDVFSSDSKKVEQTIARNLKQIPRLGYQNEAEKIAEIRDEIDELIKSQRVIKGESTAENEENELERLKQKKAVLEAEHGIDRSPVYAPVAGSFTANLDGLEDVYTIEAVENITPSSLKELGRKNPKNNSTNKISKDAPLGKIVNNYKWYVAVLLDAKVAEDLDVGDSVEIRFNELNVRTVQGTVAAVSPEEGGKVAVAVKSSKYVEAIYSTSKVSVELIKHSYEGLKIPSESIRIVDGKTGVYVVRNDKARFFPVKILYNNKKWAVISESLPDGETTIKLYDELIVDGKNLYDNKVVR